MKGDNRRALDFSQARLAGFLQALARDEQILYSLVRAHPDDAGVKRVALTATLLFKGRLESLTLNYTLFRPNGMPLRARANASFVGFTDELLLHSKIKKNSPDLTHVITVQAGDTLPLLCNRIYGRSDYYSQVAEVNGLTAFRDLRPGTQLVFPPLVGHG